MSHSHERIRLDIRDEAGVRQTQQDIPPGASSASVTSEDSFTSAVERQQPSPAQSLLDPEHDAPAEMPDLLTIYPQEDTEQLAKQRECLQLFYLTQNGNGATYDWYKDRIEARADGTCEWIFQHELFQKWLRLASGSLLVSADPGCGKSVLARYLIDHWLAQQSATIGYFFFKDQDQNTIRQLLCALLHQLFSQKSVLIQHAMEPYNKMGAALVQSERLLWAILRDAVSDPEAGPVIFVIDALDECAESQLRNLMTVLTVIFCDQQLSDDARFKVLMTSRPYERVVSEFYSLQVVSPALYIHGEEGFETFSLETISCEIYSIIRLRVEQFAKTHRLSDKIKSSLASKLLAIDHRTHLWVHLVFDHLEEGLRNTEVGIEAAIHTLPTSVNQAYDQILKRSQNDEAVKKALSIILAARRPLTLSEMNIAMNLDGQGRGRSIYYLDLENNVDFKCRLRALCGLFVNVHQGKVYFLHQTAREFLLQSSAPTTESSHLQWHRSITIRQAHSVLADTCLFYLDRLNSTDTRAFRRGDYHGAFLQYSVEHWVDHCREAEFGKDSAMADLASGQCTPALTNHSQWARILSRRYHIRPESLTNVLIASHLGLTSVTATLLSRGADIEAKDSRGRTALMLAAESGHEAVAKLLLENGANVEARDDNGWTALICAAIHDREAVARLLLEKGANVEAVDDCGWAALMHAARYGIGAVTRLLLVKGANVEAMDADGMTALLYAARYGHEAVTGLLLKAGADVKAEDDYGWAALMHAARSGHNPTVRLLLDNGADVKAWDAVGAALVLAAEFGHEAVTRLLLEKATDLETADDDGMTALMLAAECGHEAVARLLLENGAKVDAPCGDGKTPLILAAECGHEAIVRLMLNNGANIEARDDEGWTALTYAARDNREAVMRFLLKAGADVEAKDDLGWEALLHACCAGQEASIRLLLENAANPNTAGHDGCTALMHAVDFCGETMIRLLLETGADVNARDSHGRSALIGAAARCYEAVVRLLLETGADVNARDNHGGTALIHAAIFGHEEIARLLLENGANVDATSISGKTVLMFAVESSYKATALNHAARSRLERVIRLLLRNGANADAKDRYGNTVLMLADRFGYGDTLRLLLDGARRDIG